MIFLISLSWKRQTFPYILYFNSFLPNIQGVWRNFINFVGIHLNHKKDRPIFVRIANKKVLVKRQFEESALFSIRFGKILDQQSDMRRLLIRQLRYGNCILGVSSQQQVGGYLKKSAIFKSISIDGNTLSFSQLETHCLVTFIFCANSTWFKPRCILNSLMFSFNAFFIGPPRNQLLKYYYKTNAWHFKNTMIYW